MCRRRWRDLMIDASQRSREVTSAELYQVMREAYDEILNFIATPAFRSVCAELFSLPETKRPAYVREVLLNEERLRAKGVDIPKGMLLLRSAFGDRRPTLFCVKKWLPERYHSFWQNVNITFDNDFADTEVPSDERAWRKPLPADVQALLVETGTTTDELAVP
jgi:hypothetical protein